MARPVDHRRRQQLLDAAVDHVPAHGLAGLSLPPLALAAVRGSLLDLLTTGDCDRVQKALRLLPLPPDELLSGVSAER